MVGALPVGIETREYNDVPYWPTQICWTYKEVWSQPVGEWIWLMQDLHGAPVIEGETDGAAGEPIEFREEKTARVIQVAVNAADGKFRATLPQGRYTVRHGAAHTTVAALSGGIYHVELRGDRAFDFKVTVEKMSGNEVTLRIHAEGAGAHTLELKVSNLELKEAGTQKIELSSGHDAELLCHGRIIATGTPWVIVVIPDGVLSAHRDCRLFRGVDEICRSRVKAGFVIRATEIVGLTVVDGFQCVGRINGHGAHDTEGMAIYGAAQFGIDRV
jgi:hypothetical protein